MLKFENNRIYCGGISFPIPNGLYLETNFEITYDDALFLFPENKAYYLAVHLDRYAGSASERAKTEMDDVGPQISGQPKPVEINGIHGVGVLYTYTQQEHYEMYFETVVPGSDMHLSIAAGTMDKKHKAEDILKEKEVKTFLSDIRIEKEKK